MNLFKRKKIPQLSNNVAQPTSSASQSAQTSLVLNVIREGVVLTDHTGAIQYLNPAASMMCGLNSPNDAIGLDFALILHLETKEGRELSEAENPLIQAMRQGQPLKPFSCNLLVGQTDKRIPVSLSVMIADGINADRIIAFRDITEELKEEGEQMEFISTASHEMRTPVATIDGYLALCLNPQTATIDERAQKYLTAAHNASQHLGKLFQDLLDVTKLDDGHVRPQFVPAEMVAIVKEIVQGYDTRAKEGKINLTFGPHNAVNTNNAHKLEQVAYSYVDLDFVREILDNLLDNALKYTPEGGSVYVNVRGDGDRILINVTDTGMGISSDDLGHIFQKFYRADNSDTRTIGGTGLGLYLVKQRTEAMGGQVWAESAFGEGSTFYVSLPRLTAEEYEKRMIPIRNQKMQEQLNALQAAPNSSMPASPAPAPASQTQPSTTTSTPPAQPPAPPSLQSAASPMSIPTQPLTPPTSLPPTPPLT